MKRILAILFLCFQVLFINAKDIRVGLFESSDLKKADVFYNIGRFEFYSESETYGIISNKKDKISFVSAQDKVKAYFNGKYLGEKIWFRLDFRVFENSLLISDGKKKRKYQGNIILYSINGKLKVVNEIDIDKYVEGVIKGEAGYGYSLEYYKVQAVISRTYALHHQKHKKEGFDLCDHTHCQVYHGINDKEEISQAVTATSGEVLVDSSISYINTLFHSNCGGQTVSTEFVWSKKLECMESIVDTFCIHSSQAKWKRTFSKTRWVQFLAKKTGKSASSINASNLDFNQNQRKEYYRFGKDKVRLVKIRSFFRLKSTFFSVHEVGDKIVLIGKGYGHGVGLCQEGGIVMAKTHSYREVLHHYYKNVSIMPISKVEYYKLF
ncbi:MAG: SpoIID/LytB domain-containing protein [Flavobacteriales bacterium]